MRDYYEELWRRLPADLDRPDYGRRLDYLLRELRPQDRALDLGCGDAEFTAAMARAGASAVGIDVAEAALQRARTRHPELDLRLAPPDGPLPVEDGAFDLVWASEVIEHVADTARWLSEVRRALARRGRLLLSTPSHGRLRVALHGVESFSEPLGDHLHLYTARSLRGLLEEFDFGEVRIQAVGGPPLLRRMLLARAVR
jgi:SAM-dependent methyltransferase